MFRFEIRGCGDWDITGSYVKGPLKFPVFPQNAPPKAGAGLAPLEIYGLG